MFLLLLLVLQSPDSAPSSEFDVLREEWRQAQIAWQKEVKTILGDPPRMAWDDSKLPPPPWVAFRARFRELAERRIGDDVGRRALEKIIFERDSGDALSVADATWAFEALHEYHSDQPGTSPWCAGNMVRLIGSEATQEFCERIVAASIDFDARWHARHVSARNMMTEGSPAEGDSPGDEVCSAREVLDELIVHAPSDEDRRWAERGAREFDLLQVGSSAPQLAGKDEEGRPVRLADFRGKVVLIHFWGSWCYPCRVALPQKRKLWNELRGHGFVLFGVNADESPEKFKEVMGNEHIDWPNVWTKSDAPDSIAEQWNVTAWPTYFLIDRDGVIREVPKDDAEIPDAVRKLLKR